MIPHGNVIAVDTETTGLSTWLGDRPFCITFCNEKGDTGYVYWKVEPFTRKIIVNKKDIAPLDDFFSNDKIKKVFHNSKFDIRMIETLLNFKIKGQIEDTVFAARILRNEINYKLKYLASKYVGITNEDEKELQRATMAGRRMGKELGWNLAEDLEADYWTAPKDVVLKYAVTDVERTMLLWRMYEEIFKEDPISKRFYDREIKLQPYIMDIERTGVSCNLEAVRKERQSFVLHREKLLSELKVFSKRKNFNPEAAADVRKLLYSTLKFPIIKRTKKKNQPAVDNKTLNKIQHPIVKSILEHNAASKAISTFFDAYLKYTVNGTIHPNFNQMGAATGRLSCFAPNLQQASNSQTARAVMPMRARVPFGPRKGYVWYGFDYESQEVWVYADGADDQKILDRLRSGKDFHSEVAAHIWGKEAVEAEKAKGLKKLRNQAKSLFFGIIYGIGPSKVSETLEVPYREADRILTEYHNFFPGIMSHMDRMSTLARRQGYIQTAWGRKIFTDPMFAYRAVNYYVQGSGADIMKDKIITVSNYLKTFNLDARIVLSIHDELIIEAKSDIAFGHMVTVQKLMEDHRGNLKQIQKLPVGISLITKSWDQKEDIPNGTTPRISQARASVYESNRKPSNRRLFILR